jgi:hypothetical protein
MRSEQRESEISGEIGVGEDNCRNIAITLKTPFWGLAGVNECNGLWVLKNCLKGMSFRLGVLSLFPLASVKRWVPQWV